MKKRVWKLVLPVLGFLLGFVIPTQADQPIVYCYWVSYPGPGLPTGKGPGGTYFCSDMPVTITPIGPDGNPTGPGSTGKTGPGGFYGDPGIPTPPNTCGYLIGGSWFKGGCPVSILPVVANPDLPIIPVPVVTSPTPFKSPVPVPTPK